MSEALRRSPEAAFLIDAGRGLLLEANAEGARLLGIADASPFKPVTLDAGMPALADLRRLFAGGLPSAPISLVFWTARAPVRLTCTVRGATADLTSRPRALDIVLVTVAWPHAPVAQSEVPSIDAAIARLVHELRTPLAAIQSLAEVMAEGRFGPLANARYEDYAAGIRDAARHALGVVEATLMGPRAAAGEPNLAPAEIDLAELCREVVRGLASLADEAGMTIVLEAAPATDVPRVVADRTAVRQMLLNLAINALRYAGRGARLSLRTGLDADGHVWLEVADDGPGLTPEVIARALEPDRTSSLDAPRTGAARPGTGARPRTGLGLPLTNQLARANGATLSLAANAPTGLAARITFTPDPVQPD